MIKLHKLLFRKKVITQEFQEYELSEDVIEAIRLHKITVADIIYYTHLKRVCLEYLVDMRSEIDAQFLKVYGKLKDTDIFQNDGEFRKLVMGKMITLNTN